MKWILECVRIVKVNQIIVEYATFIHTTEMV